MAALDWSQCPAVESVPGEGEWGVGFSWYAEAIIEWFDLTRYQITAVLDFAARSLETPARR
jgi:hypothetical protein